MLSIIRYNFSISSTHEKDVPRLLNYITTPNILIWSAASASCAIPNVFEPVEILSKNHKGEIVPYTATKNHKFVDGSLKADLPMQRLSEIFNVNTFIVSQVNPMVIPFITDDGGGVLGTQGSAYKRVKTLIMDEYNHLFRLISTLGILPSQLEQVVAMASQNYKGHVTVSPKVRISDYKNLLRNPTPEYVAKANEISQHYTYPKISIIRSIFEIEKEIQKLAVMCKKQLENHNQSNAVEFDRATDNSLELNGADLNAVNDIDDKSLFGQFSDYKYEVNIRERRYSGNLSDKDSQDSITMVKNKGLKRVISQENNFKMRHLKNSGNLNNNKASEQPVVESKMKRNQSGLNSVKSHESLHTIVSDYVEEGDELHEHRFEISKRAAIWKNTSNKHESDSD